MTSKRNLYLFLLTLLCLWQSDDAMAQTGRLDSVQQIHEMVFTGTLKEMRKEDFAIPVEIYTQDYFLKNNVTNIYEAITMLSGV